MTADEVAVIPIIRLLVAVATLSGTPIARFISGTLTMPAADARAGPTRRPANTAPTAPNAEPVDEVAGPRQAGRERHRLGERERGRAAAGGRNAGAGDGARPAGCVGADGRELLGGRHGRSGSPAAGGRRRVAAPEHRDRDPAEQQREQALEHRHRQGERDQAADEGAAAP